MMKYNNKEYQVRDLGCKKLIDVCFIPFSGNGISICRKWELGNCPTKEEIQEIIRIEKERKKIKY